jgi:hypothetical protein
VSKLGLKIVWWTDLANCLAAFTALLMEGWSKVVGFWCRTKAWNSFSSLKGRKIINFVFHRLVTYRKTYLLGWLESGEQKDFCFKDTGKVLLKWELMNW